MKRKLSAAIALATLVPAAAFAEMNWYGKANVSFERTNEGEDTFTSLVSNASRLGVKGSEEVSDGLSAVYQFEYETYVDNGSTTFKQRNIFVGLKGNFGQVIAGNFDSPLKSAQNKVDLFNDLRGDIKHVVTDNDLRVKNVVMYSLPSSSPVGANFAYISSEDDDIDPGMSSSLTFTNDMLYAALAYDQDVREEDSSTIRAVVVGTFGSIQLGALYEQADADAWADKLDGYLVSASLKVGDKATLKAQYGGSDQLYEGGESVSVGVDFKYTKNLKSFAYYTMNSADDAADGSTVLDNDYLGVGMELKF